MQISKPFSNTYAKPVAALSLSMLVLAACQPQKLLTTGGLPSMAPASQTLAPGPASNHPLNLAARGRTVLTPLGPRLEISLAGLFDDYHTQALDCGAIATLSISITGIGIANPVTATATPASTGSCSFVSAGIPVIPAGKARIVTVTAYNAASNALATLKAPVDVVDGQTRNFDLSNRTLVTARILEELIDSFTTLGDSDTPFRLLNSTPTPTPTPTATPLGNQLGRVYAANLDLVTLQSWVDGLIGVSGTFPNYTYTRHPLLLKPSVLARAIYDNNGQIPANPPAGYLISPATLVLNFTNTYTASPLTVKLGDPTSTTQSISTPTSSQTVTISNVLPGSWNYSYSNNITGGESINFGEGQTVSLNLDVGAPAAPSSNWSRLNGGPEAGNVLKLVKDGTGQIYAATPGGVYYNSGGVWVESSQGLPAGFKLTAIAANPALADERYVFVASTNNHVYLRDFNNAGGTWQDIGEAIPVTTNNFISMLYVEPSSNAVVHAGSNQGELVRCSNALSGGPIWGGISFTQINVPIKSMVRSGDKYYLASHNGLYRGNAPNPTGWSAFNTGLGGDLNLDSVFVNAGDSTVMVGSDTGSFYTAATGSMTWTANNTGLSGAGIRDILQDTDANHTIYLATSSALKKADDSNNDGIPDLAGFSPAGNVAGSPYPPDAPINPYLTSLISDGGSALIVGSEGGGVNSYTLGGNAWASFSASLKAGQVRGILSAPNGGGMYVGIDGGGVARSTDSGDSFVQMLKAAENGKERSVTALAAEPGQAGGTFDLFMATRGAGIWVINGLFSGSSPESVWTKVGNLPDANVNAMYLINNVKLLAATASGVFYSTCPVGGSCSGGSSWTPYTGTNAPTAAYSLAYMPGGPQLYVGGTQAVHITSNGITWTKPTVGAIGTQKVLSLATLPAPGAAPDNSVIYAGLSRAGMLSNFYRSVDGGVNWAALGNPADDVDVNALVVDAGDVNKIYAGTSSGVYVSSNGGATWSPLNNGGSDHLANIEVLSLAIFNNKLYVGTRDRSVYAIDVTSGGCSPGCG